jgi:hypothetical protein
MSPRLDTSIPIVKRLLLFVIFAAASIFLTKAIFALEPGQSQRSNSSTINGKRLADKEPLSERTSFTENGPKGHWSASVIPDLSRNSTTSPVIVTGTATLMGNAEWRNLQLTHVTLKNFSPKTVLGVQLKWFITTKMDPDKILPPPGYTGLFEAHLMPGEKEKFECPLIKFSQAIKYLVKDGNLEGDFLLQVRVFEAEFEDGSTWNDDWGGPKPGDRGERVTQFVSSMAQESPQENSLVRFRSGWVEDLLTSLQNEHISQLNWLLCRDHLMLQSAGTFLLRL